MIRGRSAADRITIPIDRTRIVIVAMMYAWMLQARQYGRTALGTVKRFASPKTQPRLLVPPWTTSRHHNVLRASQKLLLFLFTSCSAAVFLQAVYTACVHRHASVYQRSAIGNSSFMITLLVSCDRVSHMCKLHCLHMRINFC